MCLWSGGGVLAGIAVRGDTNSERWRWRWRRRHLPVLVWLLGCEVCGAAWLVAQAAQAVMEAVVVSRRLLGLIDAIAESPSCNGSF
eukprot:jgi/Chlat1/4777/Chrsp308S04744